MYAALSLSASSQMESLPSVYEAYASSVQGVCQACARRVPGTCQACARRVPVLLNQMCTLLINVVESMLLNQMLVYKMYTRGLHISIYTCMAWRGRLQRPARGQSGNHTTNMSAMSATSANIKARRWRRCQAYMKRMPAVYTMGLQYVCKRSSNAIQPHAKANAQRGSQRASAQACESGRHASKRARSRRHALQLASRQRQQPTAHRVIFFSSASVYLAPTGSAAMAGINNG
jgi:hypothetical protein